jgi:pyruvate/2-oxoglutarate dehydrogenase complex dihydrolipoamide dehydrogenase (E3) component
LHEIERAAVPHISVGKPHLDWAGLIDREKAMVKDIPANLAQAMAKREAVVIEGPRPRHRRGRHDHGRVAIDDYLRSVSNPRVHVCGDALATSPQLSPLATYEGDIVGRNIVDGAKHRPDYDGMATAVYTVPALAAVGLTEAAARQKGLAAEVHINDMLGWFSARTYGETVAWSKIIVDRATDRILGAHFVGHEGQE